MTETRGFTHDSCYSYSWEDNRRSCPSVILRHSCVWLTQRYETRFYQIRSGKCCENNLLYFKAMKLYRYCTLYPKNSFFLTENYCGSSTARWAHLLRKLRATSQETINWNLFCVRGLDTLLEWKKKYKYVLFFQCLYNALYFLMWLSSLLLRLPSYMIFHFLFELAPWSILVPSGGCMTPWLRTSDLGYT